MVSITGHVNWLTMGMTSEKRRSEQQWTKWTQYHDMIPQ